MSKNNTSILHVGLDVAKLSLQLHLAGRFHSLTNDAKGHARLLKLLRAHPNAHVVCEATGGYEQSVVRTLHAAAIPVSILEAGRDSIVCLAGVSSGGRKVDFDVGGFNRSAVLGNAVVFGSVNANRSHYEAAAEALAGADKGWLSRLVSRRVPLVRWREAFTRQPDDVKVVIDFGGEALA